jgi:hypothetical protein
VTAATFVRLFALEVVLLCPLRAQQPDSSRHESLREAWWTGPLMTPSAATLPAGHLLIEPYLFDVIAPHRNGLGSQSYLVYGLRNRLSLGLIPVFGYNVVSDGPNSARVGVGDLTGFVQYRLTQFQSGHALPTASVVLEETAPTGRYDQLGNRPSDGLGSGAYTTILGVYSQTFIWMPNGRILRLRLDLTRSFPGSVTLRDVSVYGTPTGFRGTARPGPFFTASAGSEYSLTRHWVLALDVAYTHDGDTRVNGDVIAGGGSVPAESHSGVSTPVAFAPAVEYNLGPAVGVIVGVRIIPSGPNLTGTVTPAVAVNVVQ